MCVSLVRPNGPMARSAAELERELAANTFDDGLNRELATDYHRFVLGLGLVAAVEADADGHPSLTQHGSASHGCSMPAPPSWMPPAGLRGRVTATKAARSWSTTLTAIHGLQSSPGRCTVGSPTGGLLSPARSRRLCSAHSENRVSYRAQTVRPRRFPDAGLVILRFPPRGGAGDLVPMRRGPPGFLSIAAHAHADALSVEVRHDGVDILADPGTYCYHGEPGWRDWFRSTSAHNTVELDGQNQSQSGGPFLWTTQARTTPLMCDIGDQATQTWSAEHDGYRRLNIPTIAPAFGDVGFTGTPADDRGHLRYHRGGSIAAVVAPGS